MRRREPEPVVVTDLHEPLIAVHRRQIRTRLVMMVVWIAGWVVAGTLWRHGYLATGILLASGPGIWITWWLVVPRRVAGRRSPVTARRARALPTGDGTGPTGDGAGPTRGGPGATRGG